MSRGRALLNEKAPETCFGNSVLGNCIPIVIDKKSWEDRRGT